MVLVLLSLTVSAQGKKFSNKEHGYNFTAPAGWTVKEEEGKCARFTFTNADQTVAIIVSAAHSASLADYLKNEKKVLNLGFSPTGKVQENNGVQGLRLTKTANGYQTTLDTFLLPLGEEDAVAVMALIGGEAYFTEAHNAVLQIIKSVKLSFSRKLKKALTETEKDLAEQSNQNGSSPSPDDSAADGQISGWGTMLSGKKLEFFKNGYSRTYRFCGGSFSQNGAALNSSQNGYGSVNTSLTGRWSVQGNTLVLRYNDGEVANFQLSQGEDKGGVRLDGTFYRMTATDCS
jgi:hypothetical protein